MRSSLGCIAVWCLANVVPTGSLVNSSAVPSNTLRLGYLYVQSPSSWVVESFSQFRLAVQRVNDDPLLLPGKTLVWSKHDTQGNSAAALEGALQLLQHKDFVGIVGTGYTDALAAPALYASLKKTQVSGGLDFVILPHLPNTPTTEQIYVINVSPPHSPSRQGLLQDQRKRAQTKRLRPSLFHRKPRVP